MAEAAGAVSDAAFTLTGFDTDEPIVAVSLHSGTRVRPALEERLALDDQARRREEDSYIDLLAAAAKARVMVHVSRFEVDLNRPPHKALYRFPEDSWGFTVWRQEPPESELERSRAIHRRFYEAVEHHFALLARRFRRFLVLDLHSYNHRRGGPNAPPAHATGAPEVNIGTGTMDRNFFGSVVDRFIGELRNGAPPQLGELDVRENVNFRGGYFPGWVHHRFTRTACAIAVEVKKTYMNEWLGHVDLERLDALRLAVRRAAVGAAAELEALP
jgi:N-formylglutamate amidohydrolase